MFGGRQIYQMSSGISGLSPIQDKYTELYLKGEEKGEEKTAGSANNIVLAFREQSFSGAKMRSLGRFDALFGVF